MVNSTLGVLIVYKSNKPYRKFKRNHKSSHFAQAQLQQEYVAKMMAEGKEKR